MQSLKQHWLPRWRATLNTRGVAEASTHGSERWHRPMTRWLQVWFLEGEGMAVPPAFTQYSALQTDHVNMQCVNKSVLPLHVIWWAGRCTSGEGEDRGVLLKEHTLQEAGWDKDLIRVKKSCKMAGCAERSRSMGRCNRCTVWMSSNGSWPPHNADGLRINKLKIPNCLGLHNTTVISKHSFYIGLHNKRQ